MKLISRDKCPLMKRIYLIIRSFDFYRTIIFHLIKFYILIYRKNIQAAQIRVIKTFLPRCAFTLSILNLFVIILQLIHLEYSTSQIEFPTTRINISIKFGWLKTRDTFEYLLLTGRFLSRSYFNRENIPIQIEN